MKTIIKPVPLPSPQVAISRPPRTVIPQKPYTTPNGVGLKLDVKG